MKAQSFYNDPENEWLIDCDNDAVIDKSCCLIVNGRSVEVTWVFNTSHFREYDADKKYITGFAYDEEGAFYGIRIIEDGYDNTKTAIVKLHGKAALAWFAGNVSWDEAFARELCRAIDNPQFEFMDLVPVGAKKKRFRKKGEKFAGQFHEQLHMATALVESVRKLDAEPTLDNLAEACRSATALHQSMHAPENFKRAAQA